MMITIVFPHSHASGREIRKNHLGRNGWLDRLRLGIIDYDRELYLAPYNS